MKKSILFTLALSLATCLFAQEFYEANESFEFSVLNIDDSADISATDMNTAITERTRISTKDGHLYAGGKRIKIYGMNITDIPSRRMADQTAKNLAQRGFNGVRFHDMDKGDGTALFTTLTNGTTIADFAKLDDFDYFFAQLKRYGIYCDLNLISDRDYTEADGFPAGTDQIKDKKAVQIMAAFNDVAKNIEKDWIKQILNHVNPYTHTAYKEDPGLAIVEIMDENGLINNYLADKFDLYPDELLVSLENKWNKWLKNKGENLTTMQTKYNYAEATENSLVNSASKFKLNTYQKSKASVKYNKNENSHAINVKRAGTDSADVSYTTGKLPISGEQNYTISFYAKASADSTAKVTITQNHAPWQELGFTQNIAVGLDWKYYSFKVSGLKSDMNSAFTFTGMGLSEGITYYIKDAVISMGTGTANVKESFREGKVHFPTHKEYTGMANNSISMEYRKMIMDFLYETEIEFWTEMKDYIRKELKCKSLIQGTQIGQSFYSAQEIFDIIDVHAVHNPAKYNGIEYTGLEEDEPDIYSVKNTSLAAQKDGGVLAQTASLRVYGKPFSVSEYDHPYPNQFAAEMYPMWATFACLQDWDCLWASSSTSIPLEQEERVKIKTHDDNLRNPVKAAAAPIAARIFRNSLINPANVSIYVPVSEETERSEIRYQSADHLSFPAEYYGFIPETALSHQVGITLGDYIPSNGILYTDAKAESDEIKKNCSNERAGVASDNGQIYWNPAAGVYVASYLNTYVFIGDNNGYRAYTYSSNQLNMGDYTFTPYDDFTVLAIARKNENTDFGFISGWSGNAFERLRIYEGKLAYSPFELDMSRYTRENVLLTTDVNFGSGPALTMGANGSISSSGEWTYTWLTETGKEDTNPERQERTYSWNTTKASNSLWFKVRK